MWGPAHGWLWLQALKCSSLLIPNNRSFFSKRNNLNSICFRPTLSLKAKCSQTKINSLHFSSPSCRFLGKGLQLTQFRWSSALLAVKSVKSVKSGWALGGGSHWIQGLPRTLRLWEQMQFRASLGAKWKPQNGLPLLRRLEQRKENFRLTGKVQTGLIVERHLRLGNLESFLRYAMSETYHVTWASQKQQFNVTPYMNRIAGKEITFIL